MAGTDFASQKLRFERVYASADFSDAGALLRQFMRDAQMTSAPDCLTLALPGVVEMKLARLTNLDWTLDADALGRALGIPAVQFINDFQAAALAVATLTERDTLMLNPSPVQSGGVRAITGAGTGLGLAWMQAGADGHYRAYATEGGHIDFAPANAQQSRLLDFVRREPDVAGQPAHVSWERMVSGLGLGAIYRFCCFESAGTLPVITADGARVSELAAQGDAVANSTLDLFVDLYGAWVGNVALLYQPVGGLYIAGGVAIHLQQRMQSQRFMAACTDKGRMRGVVERTPIFLITNKRLGVQGAIAFSCQPTALNRNLARTEL